MEQKIVKLQIADEYITGAGVSVGAVGSHDEVLLEMDFRRSPMWFGTTRRAIFSNALGVAVPPIILTTNLLAEGQTEVYLVPVPQEAKDAEGDCFLTVEGFVTGAGGKEIIRCVTEEATFRVLPSKLYVNENDPITPSQAEQLQAEIDSIKADIVEAAAAADSADKAAASAAAAAASATEAGTKALAASASASAAAAAKDVTEAAAADSTAAKTDAQAAKTAAESARTAAQAAQSAAETARTAAAQSATQASGSAESAAADSAAAADAKAEAVSAKGTAVAAAEQARSASIQAQNAAEQAQNAAEQVEGVPIVTTHTPEYGYDGVNYDVDIPGVTQLSVGMELIIIPHVTAAAESEATCHDLSVNNSLETSAEIRRVRREDGDTLPFFDEELARWMIAGVPVHVMYDGKSWILESNPKPFADDLSGIVPVENGGTGLCDIPAYSILMGVGDNVIAAVDPGMILGYPLSVYGGEMLGPLTVQEPTEAGHAASKGYVDALVGDVETLLAAL